MAFQTKTHRELLNELSAYKARLIAVSKKKPVEDIVEAQLAGQLDFGENYVQELEEKHTALPHNVRWHFIGHLQSNKVKHIVPFVHLIQGVDSFKLLKEINKEGQKTNRIVDCLLQVHIADESTKFGFSEQEVEALMLFPELSEFENIRIRGLMGMATFSDDQTKIKKEFTSLHSLFGNCRIMSMDPQHFDVLSMGMSHDYKIALDCGSNMVRIGSMLFGERN